jgi:hypothetical protein
MYFPLVQLSGVGDGEFEASLQVHNFTTYHLLRREYFVLRREFHTL